MAGPEPSKTIEKIQELQKTKNFTIIQGNTDEMIANCDNQMLYLLEQNVPVMAHALENDVTVISEEQKKYLPHATTPCLVRHPPGMKLRRFVTMELSLARHRSASLRHS